jgi:hypothetical protein
MIPVILFVYVLLLCHFLLLYIAGLTLRGFWNEVLTKIFRPEINERDGENHMKRNVIICTRHVLLLGKLNEEGRDGRDMQHVWWK